MNPRRPSIRPEILTTAAVFILLYVAVTRIVGQFQKYSALEFLLRAEAKCPGLPFGQNSGGPDYINIALDLALIGAAAYLVYLTTRDLRRKRRRP